MTSAPSTAPTKRPVAALAATVIALLLVAVAVVAVRDLAVVQGWTTGRPWVAQLVTAADGLRPSIGVLVAGVVCMLVGLVLIWAVVRPSTRTHQRAGVADADVWISASAVATVAREAADRVAGVLSATAHARKRRVDVTAAATETGGDLADRVEHAVRSQLNGLDDRRVRVRVRENT